MSWDLTVRGKEGNLDTLAAVRETILRLFPSARFGREPSGAEKIQAAEAQGIRFPSVVRESMMSHPAIHAAEFEAEGVSLRFCFGSEDVVQSIGLEVRGSGDPFPFLRQLAGVGNWQVIDDSTGQALSADAQSVGTGWYAYKRMLATARDRE